MSNIHYGINLINVVNDLIYYAWLFHISKRYKETLI